LWWTTKDCDVIQILLTVKKPRIMFANVIFPISIFSPVNLHYSPFLGVSCQLVSQRCLSWKETLTSLSLTHTPTHTPTHTHTHTHTLSLDVETISAPHTSSQRPLNSFYLLSLSFSFSLTQKVWVASFALSLSHKHTNKNTNKQHKHTHTISLSLSLSHTHTLSYTYIHTQTNTHTHTHFLSLSYVEESVKDFSYKFKMGSSTVFAHKWAKINLNIQI